MNEELEIRRFEKQIKFTLVKAVDDEPTWCKLTFTDMELGDSFRVTIERLDTSDGTGNAARLQDV